MTEKRWVRRGVVALLVLDLLVGGATLGLHGRDRAEVFSAEDAVAEFRSSAGAPSDGAGAAPTTPSTLAAGVPVTVGAGEDLASPQGAAPEGRAPDPAAVTSTTVPAATPGAEVATPPFPAEGVYVYDTTGFEELDALGGSRHDYPAQTVIVHRLEGCGATETWQPFQDRKDVRQLCPAPGRHRAAWFESTRSFFGQSDTRRLECDEDAVTFVAGAQPGEAFDFRCVQDGGADAANRLEILAVEPIVVAGARVESVRTRSTSVVTGDASATTTIESWVHPETGLTLKRVSVLDGTSPGPGGSVRYHEEYTLLLRSLEPRR